MLRRMLHGLRDYGLQVDDDVLGSRSRGGCRQDGCPKLGPISREVIPCFSRDHNTVILIFRACKDQLIPTKWKVL